MKRGVRPYKQIPRILLTGFLILFVVQILFHRSSILQQTSYRPLASPFPAAIYSGLSMGSQKLLSYLLAIRLQFHDNQAGKHILYDRLDYQKLVEWMDQIYLINPQSEYPMMLASRIYSQTRDKDRLRIILEYIDRTFEQNPQLHWRRLAEASVIAKHQLGDMRLALKMAQKISNQPATIKIPRWARDLEFILLGDMNEYESAITIIIALLQSKSVKDPDEVRFLKDKLLMFQQKLSESQQ